jgi:hypothetical protein
LPDLGDTLCAKLTTKALRDWQNGLTKAAPRIRTKKGQPQRFSAVEPEDPKEAARRRQSSANRTLTVLKAALNARRGVMARLHRTRLGGLSRRSRKPTRRGCGI